MKGLLPATIINLALFLSGCATIFGENGKTIQVHSQPENAQVLINNMPVGTTPALVTIPSTWSASTLTFRKKGYADQYAQVNTSFQTVGLLNIFFWPGFIVDAVSGDMMKISPDSRATYVNLSKPA